VRPTAESVRESIFNILSASVEGAVFLDLFSGSGAVGIEALSRGARKAVFVDDSRVGCEIIRANLSALALTERSCVLCADVTDETAFPPALSGALLRLSETGADLIFADPPYKLPKLTLLPEFIVATGCCAGGALLIVEHSRRTEMPERARDFVKYRTREYGDTGLSFYRAEPNCEL
jgi:16S rRNA (guanine(966)-N(2))-methyltransferase RsmD